MSSSSSNSDSDSGDNHKKRKVVSKHKQQDKHRLKHDTLFKGKKQEEPLQEDYTEHYFNDDFTYDPQSSYYKETMNNFDYVREKKLKEEIYNILIEKTDVNFMSNRRKPSRDAFNMYYTEIDTGLKNENYTHVEKFVELSYYFSDNLFNMFKLLDGKWRDKIIEELQKHIGETPEKSKDIEPKNLIENAEIEFEIDVEESEPKIITGVIIEVNHEEKIYKVDTYENVYEVPIECITKILNNRKFKYNLNKLNNLDIF